ncbi:rna ligase cyclic nucleotide phosphodiesterase [Trichoderma arundinaceum]|uniref:Rna ligase cyclic nucleotide phosphodiesterase n=1 Tax=Trichoderma arundinaceum TaxID=490622 RepID=A0A395NID2_TRIAR|nr:rna ligase cyclic nucleotide phosphodiesterase [Trichoderma arundinaceum]
MTTTSTVTTTAVAPKRPLYPIGIPAKFSSDGVVQRFPGNTTLCHVPADSPIQPGLNAVHASLSSHPVLSKLIHLLPKDSWHMTVVDGVRDTECEPGMWPPGMEKQPLEECTKEFSQRLRQLGPELEKEGLAPPYKMRVRGFDPAVVGIGLEIEGATAEEEKRMRRLRDRLADILGFRAPNHETYGFHISMAYLMRHIDGENRELLNEVFAQHLPALQREFDLGPVEFCTFENMYAFARLFYLGE